MISPDISFERINYLNKGTIETKNLMEGLSIDFKKLLDNNFPELAHVKLDFPHLGITHRMKYMGDIFLREKTFTYFNILKNHPSDIIRGWACYMVGLSDFSLKDSLILIKPLADDKHFWVREWAWIVVRKLITDNLEQTIDILKIWAINPSENIRRFAIESTRPRGVWCAHIESLKQDPSLALPLLELIREDTARYVQLSLGNWLNDAAKSKPEWVINLCNQWQTSASDLNIANKIIKRALRSIKA